MADPARRNGSGGIQESGAEFRRPGFGAYFSALSNEANLKGRPCAWLIFGVENDTHEVVGSQYKNSRPALDAIKKKNADQTAGRHTFVEIHELRYTNGKRVVMFEIPPAPQGIPIDYQGHYYGRDGESLQALSMEKIERIRNQVRLLDIELLNRVQLRRVKNRYDRDDCENRIRRSMRYTIRLKRVCLIAVTGMIWSIG
nr:ATP-binding protein [Akkermansia muciniphila]